MRTVAKLKGYSSADNNAEDYAESGNIYSEATVLPDAIQIEVMVG